LKFRKALDKEGNMVYESNIRGSPMQKMFVETITAPTKEKLAMQPAILEFMSPNFDVACRRLTPGPGYLEALSEENVDFIPDKTASIMRMALPWRTAGKSILMFLRVRLALMSLLCLHST
jgi:hypothetical protein